MSLLRAVGFVLLACVGTALQAAAVPLGPASVGADLTVDVDRFGVERVESLVPGVPLRFSLYGSPGARVLIALDGGVDELLLRETRPGMYEGEYVIGPRDRIDAHSRVIATVERDGVVAHAPLAEPLVLERGTVPWTAILGTGTATTGPSAPRSAEAARPSSPSAAPTITVLPSTFADATTTPSAATCSDCATVQSIVPLPPMPHDVLAGLAGAVAGAAAANAASDGRARQVLRAVGAFTGYVVGGELARRLTRPAGYDVVLRRADGSMLLRRYDAEPAFHVGDTVSLSATSQATRPGSF